MRINNVNQKGFAVIEALLIIAVVAIVGGTGYYVYHANKKTNDTLNSASKVAQSSPEKQQKKKSTSKPASQSTPVPAATDDKAAILAAIKARIESQPVINQDNGHQITFTYTVDEISGAKARGSMRASEGDPQTYIAQKQNGIWQIIYTGHLPPAGPETCTKYSLPSSWCMPNPY